MRGTTLELGRYPKMVVIGYVNSASAQHPHHPVAVVGHHGDPSGPGIEIDSLADGCRSPPASSTPGGRRSVTVTESGLRLAGSLDGAVHGGPSDGEQLGEFGGGVFSGSVQPDKVCLPGSAELRLLAPQGLSEGTRMLLNGLVTHDAGGTLAPIGRAGLVSTRTAVTASTST